MSADRLAEIRERANLQCGLDGPDAYALVKHVDHLAAELKRLRSGIETLHRRARDGNYCWYCDYDWPCKSVALLNPPTNNRETT